MWAGSVCQGTEVLGGSGANVKVRSEHMSIAVKGGPDRSIHNMKRSRLERLRRRGLWDGWVKVSIGGSEFAVEMPDPRRSSTSRLHKAKAHSFDLERMAIRVPEEFWDEESGSVAVRYVEPSAVQRISAERALLLETMRNIKSDAKENLAFSREVLDAAADHAMREHASMSRLRGSLPVEMGTPEGRAKLREAIARHMRTESPERAIFFAVHERVRHNPGGVYISGLASPGALLSDGSRLHERAGYHLDWLAAIESGASHLPEPSFRYSPPTVDEVGFGYGEGGQLLVPGGLSDIQSTPAAHAVRALLSDKRDLSEEGRSRFKDDLGAALASGEVAHRGFRVALALSDTPEAREILGFLNEHQLRMVASNSPVADVRSRAKGLLASGPHSATYIGSAMRDRSRREEIGRVFADRLDVVARMVATNPSLVGDPDVQAQLLELSTTSSMLLDGFKVSAAADNLKGRGGVSSDIHREKAAVLSGRARGSSDHGDTFQRQVARAVDDLIKASDENHMRIRSFTSLARAVDDLIKASEDPSSDPFRSMRDKAMSGPRRALAELLVLGATNPYLPDGSLPASPGSPLESRSDRYVPPAVGGVDRHSGSPDSPFGRVSLDMSRKISDVAVSRGDDGVIRTVEPRKRTRDEGERDLKPPLRKRTRDDSEPPQKRTRDEGERDLEPTLRKRTRDDGEPLRKRTRDGDSPWE